VAGLAPDYNNSPLARQLVLFAILWKTFRGPTMKRTEISASF